MEDLLDEFGPVADIRIHKTEVIANWQYLYGTFFCVPESVSMEAFWARVITRIAFAFWGGYFITAGVDWEIIGSSFMHYINLPFHEFGHVLFMPFGEFMMVLGGSLFQVLLPALLMCVFVFNSAILLPVALCSGGAGRVLLMSHPISLMQNTACCR